MELIKSKLNSNQLKLIAIVAMTIDHTAWVLFPNYTSEMLPIVLHIIGRITCPIMCYFIAEGYYYTRDVKKYTARLFGFAVISHFAYMYASTSYIDWKSFIPFYYGNFFNQTSVIWSLAWGLVMLRTVYSEKIRSNYLKVVIIILICLVSFPADWSCIGSLCVLFFGINRGKFKSQMTWLLLCVFIYSIVCIFAVNVVYGLIHAGVVLAIPLLKIYNGKRGKSAKVNKIMKWMFYIYYPLHLTVVGFIQSML